MATIGYELKSSAVVRAAAILTTAYVPTTAVSVTGDRGGNNVTFLIDFTIGSLTSLSVKFEASDDGTNWYAVTAKDTASAAVTANELITPLRVDVLKLDASQSTSYRVEVGMRYARASLKGVGTLTSSSATVSAIVVAI